MENIDAVHRLIEAVYQEHVSGGNAHIVVDDMNLEDEWIDSCLSNTNLTNAEEVCLEALRSMPFELRFDAVIQYHNRV